MNLASKYPLFDEATDPAVPAGGGGAATPAPASSGSDVDWEKESAPEDEIEGLKVTPIAKPAAPAAKVEVPPKPAAPAVTSPATPAASAPVAPTVPAAPAVPAAPPPAAQVPVVEAPSAPLVQPTPQAPDRAVLRSNYVQELTQKYALTDEQTRGILVEPEKHLPGLMANMHVEVADAVINTVMQMLPSFVLDLTRQTSDVQKAQEEFYSAWPSLNKPEFLETVSSAIAAYKQLKPKAPRAEVIRAAGLTAMISLRLPLPRDLFSEEPPAQPAPPAPFQHAAPGAGGVPPAPQKPSNPFQMLNEEFDAEDRG